ncbi:MAG: hypothetical protein N3F66_09565 [Spirochaetes bacterium]|nr:hypothetical protein [Spirochaetota bacterium]
MIDDELDRILQDIDSEKDFTVQKSPGKHFKEVTFENEHDEIVHEVPLPEKKDVSEVTKFFKRGLSNGIHRHVELAKLLRSRLDIAEVPEQVVPVIKKSSYSIFKIIEDIEILTDKFISEINEASLRRKATKDFPLYFPDDYPDDNRLDFIVLKEIYILLRAFSSLVKKDWSELEKQSAVFNFTEGGKQLALALNDIIVEGNSLCKATDILLELIAHHLGLLSFHYNLSDVDIRSKLRFNEYKSYTLQSILNEIDSSQTKNELEVAPKDLEFDSYAQLGELTKKHIDTSSLSKHSDNDEHIHKPHVSSVQNETIVPFTVKGAKAWNTREPYILPVDVNVYNIENDDLLYLVYYTKSQLSEEQIKSELRRALLKLTIDKEKYDIVEDYIEFLNKKIVSILHESIDYFQIPENDQWLYYYHLGPHTICRLLIADIQMTGEGYCFSSRDGKKIKKLVPYEYIKTIVLEWCENNVNNRDLPFDSVNALDLIRRQVSKKYFSEIDEFVAKIDAYLGTLNPDTLKKLDRKSFIKQKALQVYNQKQIIVFNRFIDRTIFK